MKPHVKKYSLRDMFNRKHFKFITQFVAQGTMAIAGAIMWPIFVFLVLEDVASVGFMATISALGMILFTLLIGRISDRVRRSMILKAGGVFMAATFFLRIFALDTIAVFTISFFAGLFSVLVDLPILASFYDTANKEDTTEIVVLRELGLGIGKMLSIAVVLIVLNKFFVGFSIGGFASLLLSLI
jgi:MFS family permease